MRPSSSTAETTTSQIASPAPIYSRLADDPTLCDLVELFVGDMPERISSFECQAKNRDWDALARTAHQLKGSAGSYGFSEITPYAARLEAAAQDAEHEEAILSALNELLGICRRARAGVGV
jgi:HPt (histidine-containing phosphotransfer) domain-containing protein